MIKNKKNKGFTLVEMVVALSIFAIAMTNAINIFVQSNQIQKRTANIQRLISDARYTVEIMAREIRLGYIDYDYSDYFSELDLPVEVDNRPLLALRDRNNNPIRFRSEEVEENRFAVQICRADDCADEWYDITPEDISVDYLAFYITPTKDPFTIDVGLNPPDFPSNQQPLVTIVLKVRSMHAERLGIKEANFQTTVTTRNYSR